MFNFCLWQLNLNYYFVRPKIHFSPKTGALSTPFDVPFSKRDTENTNFFFIKVIEGLLKVALIRSISSIKMGELFGLQWHRWQNWWWNLDTSPWYPIPDTKSSSYNTAVALLCCIVPISDTLPFGDGWQRGVRVDAQTKDRGYLIPIKFGESINESFCDRPAVICHRICYVQCLYTEHATGKTSRSTEFAKETIFIVANWNSVRGLRWCFLVIYWEVIFFCRYPFPTHVNTQVTCSGFESISHKPFSSHGVQATYAASW